MDPRGRISGRRVTFAVLALVELIVLVAGCLDRPGAGAQPLAKTATAKPLRPVTAPPPLRVIASGASSGRWLVYTSGPVRPGPSQELCGTDKVSVVASSQVAVAESTRACSARLRLTGPDGDQVTVPVTVPARPQAG